MNVSRRQFLQSAMLGAAPFAVFLGHRQDPARPAKPAPLPGAAPGDPLAEPVGRASAPLGTLDNDPGVIAIERRLRCRCGCTLDVYTCRTTDFSCTYSPAMHQDVVTQVSRGAPADQIVQTFVQQYGEAVLMAPPPTGFNLAGYLVPGVSVAAVGLGLATWLTRHTRQPVAAASPPIAPVPVPEAGQLQRLQRALDDIES